MKVISLYKHATSIRRVLCSKKGYVEYIEKESKLFGKSHCYALFNHDGVLIGTCDFESGVDRFREFSEMRDFLLGDRQVYDPKTNAITECLGTLAG